MDAELWGCRVDPERPGGAVRQLLAPEELVNRCPPVGLGQSGAERLRVQMTQGDLTDEIAAAQQLAHLFRIGRDIEQVTIDVRRAPPVGGVPGAVTLGLNRPPGSQDPNYFMTVLPTR